MFGPEDVSWSILDIAAAAERLSPDPGKTPAERLVDRMAGRPALAAEPETPSA